jgi:hypothetical protein
MARKNLRRDLSRDDLISLASTDKITSAEADEQAAANGWEPFEHQPPLPKFDPNRDTRWSLVMTIAWIAWRDFSLVREQNEAFRAECMHWMYREWKVPAKGGKKFKRQAGYHLERWSKPSISRLSLLEILMGIKKNVPETRQVAVAEAVQLLQRALSDGRIVAEAINEAGRPMEIPGHDWPHLKIIEEKDVDVLKFNILDAAPAYREVQLKRDAILQLWPPITQHRAYSVEHALVDLAMIEPIAKSRKEGLIPLCSAVHWIMTKRGTVPRELGDTQAWDSASAELLSLLQEGDMELVGVKVAGSLPEAVPRNYLALAKSTFFLKVQDAHAMPDEAASIACVPFTDVNQWTAGLNDRLYLQGRPAWTHLQVHKSKVLERWPTPTPQRQPEVACRQWLLEQMRQSPSRRPKSKASLLFEACAQFTGLKDRQFERAWSLALAESGADWSKPGPIG